MYLSKIYFEIITDAAVVKTHRLPHYSCFTKNVIVSHYVEINVVVKLNLGGNFYKKMYLKMLFHNNRYFTGKMNYSELVKNKFLRNNF
jgi:hypothetical protein